MGDNACDGGHGHDADNDGDGAEDKGCSGDDDDENDEDAREDDTVAEMNCDSALIADTIIVLHGFASDRCSGYACIELSLAIPRTLNRLSTHFSNPSS